MKEGEGNNYLLLENLLQLLSCPVCWRSCDPETLIQCHNGHFGCWSCFNRLNTSPLCRAILKHRTTLTFSTETLALILKELRHVECHKALISPEAMVELFKCTKCEFAPSMLPVLQCQKGHVHCCRSPDPDGIYSTCIFTTQSRLSPVRRST